jgi:hypothetical protein
MFHAHLQLSGHIPAKQQSSVRWEERRIPSLAGSQAPKLKLHWPGVSRTALGVAQPRTGRHAWLNCRRRLKKTNADTSPLPRGRQLPVVHGHAAHGFTGEAGIRTRRHTAGGMACKAEHRGFFKPYPGAACGFHLVRKETERRLRSGGVTGGRNPISRLVNATLYGKKRDQICMSLFSSGVVTQLSTKPNRPLSFNSYTALRKPVIAAR